MKRDPKTGRILKTHGYFGSRVYRIWQGMKNRATNKADKDANNYINRGIDIDPRWHRFEDFIADMGEPPTAKHSIERIENEHGYWPNNCRWATSREQANNRRNNFVIEYRGQKKTLKEWSRKLNLNPETLSYRLRGGGWPIERAFNTPIRPK